MWCDAFWLLGTSRNQTRRGPSWLTALGHAKDSLWSLDLFRCESAIQKSYYSHGKRQERQNPKTYLSQVEFTLRDAVRMRSVV